MTLIFYPDKKFFVDLFCFLNVSLMGLEMLTCVSFTVNKSPITFNFVCFLARLCNRIGRKTDVTKMYKKFFVVSDQSHYLTFFCGSKRKKIGGTRQRQEIWMRGNSPVYKCSLIFFFKWLQMNQRTFLENLIPKVFIYTCPPLRLLVELIKFYCHQINLFYFKTLEDKNFFNNR